MRLFVGLPAPASPTYDAVTRELLAIAPQARPAALPHVTLRFMGEVHDPAPVITALDAACKHRAALPCVVEGLGTFPRAFPPDSKARIAWAGVRAPGIDALAKAVVQATASFGEPPEQRPFVAHVTLARMPRPTDLRSIVQRHRNTLFAQGNLDRVVLYKSALGAEGSSYEPLHTVVLH